MTTSGRDERTGLLSDVAAYYAAKLAEHGHSARGVDWNGEASQRLRFEQLCKLIDLSRPFSINDLGCGYGALLDFLSAQGARFTYAGFDVAESMLQAARQRPGPNARFILSSEPDQEADYGVASGIFNVLLGRSRDEWRAYLTDTLDGLHRTSRRGFAFNCLTSYSDPERMREDLFYADPCELFDLCKRRYSREVALLHDYGLFEFTILVRKPS